MNDMVKNSFHLRVGREQFAYALAYAAQIGLKDSHMFSRASLEQFCFRVVIGSLDCLRLL